MCFFRPIAVCLLRLHPLADQNLAAVAAINAGCSTDAIRETFEAAKQRAADSK